MPWQTLLCSLLIVVNLAGPNREDEIHRAVRAGDLAGVRALLDEDPTRVRARDAAGLEPVHVAVFGGRVEILELLLARGADANAPDAWGVSPLLRAVQTGRMELLDPLVRYGGDPNRFAAGGESPLLVALSKGYGRADRAMAERLLALGASARASGLYGETSLHRAAEGGDAALVGILVRAGADVNARYRGDLTPLHVAAAHGHLEVAQALLEHGADPDATSHWCGTPLDQAGAAGHPAVAALLRRRGASEVPRRFPRLSGPFLGQGLPSGEPVVFAPGVLANVFRWIGPPSFSADGREVVWSAGEPHDFHHRIWTMREVRGVWTAPKVVPFAGPWSDANPALSLDGRWLFFKSDRPVDTQAATSPQHHIWVSERRGDQWSQPTPVRETFVPGKIQGFPAIDRAGHLVYQGIEQADGLGGGDLYVCTWSNGRCTAPRSLGPAVNSPAFEAAPAISGDGARLVFMSTRSDAKSGLPTRLFSSARKADGTWDAPSPLATGSVPVRQPMLSPDGRTLFYVRDLDVMATGFVPGSPRR